MLSVIRKYGFVFFAIGGVSLFSVTMLEAQEINEESAEVFVYDDHGKRDPLWPLVNSSGIIVNYEKEVLVSDLILEGIIGGADGENMAIINGRVIQAPDKIGEFHVQEITEHAVILYKDEQRFELKLKKEE